MISLNHLIKQHSVLPSFSTTLLDAHEQPVDLTGCSASLRMVRIGDSSITSGGPVTLVEAEGGIVSYDFTTTDTMVSGSYLATIEVLFPGAKKQTFPYNDYFLFQVEEDLSEDSDDPSIELVFATQADARAMGSRYADLSAEDLIRAQGMIEVMCGRMVETIVEAKANDKISASDLSRLKKATVYQAAWIQANEDVEERTDVTQLRTAGLSGESAQLTADGITLAPLARRLLIGLSWVRSRSIRTSTNPGVYGVSTTTIVGGGWAPMNRGS